MYEDPILKKECMNLKRKSRRRKKELSLKSRNGLRCKRILKLNSKLNEKRNWKRSSRWTRKWKRSKKIKERLWKLSTKQNLMRLMKQSLKDKRKGKRQSRIGRNLRKALNKKNTCLLKLKRDTKRISYFQDLKRRNNNWMKSEISINQLERSSLMNMRKIIKRKESFKLTKRGLKEKSTTLR
jgi:hypothetical protein